MAKIWQKDYAVSETSSYLIDLSYKIHKLQH